ncbi:ANK-REP-REGION domain-containing protein [Aphelenchoides besseyi]|nr:ANK-REP-REGION domain-containing protein [Aphelenchoides besseyi]KAI6201607.1 ANK-REP-REGION domain-containing protein [Aphelenchoides besseyi]
MCEVTSISSTIGALYAVGEKTFVKYHRHPLHLAVAMNDKLKIRQLLDSRIPFQIAVLGKDIELVQFLIDQGSCIDHADYNQTTAAHFCITYNKFEAFQLLLDAGADFLQVDKWSKSAFDVACELGRNEMLDEFIDQGIVQEVIRRVNTSVRLNNTCLHLAARNGHVDICYKLLELGFNINVTTDKGSALHEAISGTHIHVVRLLLHLGIDHQIVDRNQQTAKMLAEKCSEQMSVSGSLINTLLQRKCLEIYGPVNSRSESACDFVCQLRKTRLRKQPLTVYDSSFVFYNREHAC